MPEDIEFPNADEIMKRALRDLADEIFTESQKNIVDMDITNSGFLLKSGNVQEMSDTHMRISYSAPHAEFVEFGTGPHMPPVAPIKKWVQDKLRIANDKRAQQIAWAIAKDIEKFGIQERPFLRNARDSVIQ